VRKPTRRINKWVAKSNTERLEATLDEVQPDMIRNYASITAEMWAIETRVKQVVCQHSVQSILMVSYLNFGRQMFKLQRTRQHDARVLELEAQGLINRWAARGLDPVVLAAIRTEVFNVATPWSAARLLGSDQPRARARLLAAQRQEVDSGRAVAQVHGRGPDAGCKRQLLHAPARGIEQN